MNWLIAEDETDIRNLVAMMCQVWGHTPMTFESGQKTWDWLDQVENGQYKGTMPDFALMDIRMPGRRGNEIANRSGRTLANRFSRTWMNLSWMSTGSGWRASSRKSSSWLACSPRWMKASSCRIPKGASPS